MISYQFTMKEGPTPGKIIQLVKPELSIGRELANDIVISDADVSRRHVRLTRQGDSYLLEDLASTNGTYVNGQRLTAPQILQPADQIKLGETVMLIFETLTHDAQPTRLEKRPEPILPTQLAAPVAPPPAMVPPLPPDKSPIESPEIGSPQPPASLAASVLKAVGKVPGDDTPVVEVPASDTPAKTDSAAGSPALQLPVFPSASDPNRNLKIGLIVGGVVLVLICFLVVVGAIVIALVAR